jgi:hypothetical protein
MLGASTLGYISQPNPWTGRQELHAVANDPVMVQVRSSSLSTTSLSRAMNNQLVAVFFLNTADYPVQRTYALDSLGLKGPLYAFDWDEDRAWPEMLDEISVRLERHAGKLIFLGREAISAAPETLP